MLCEGFEACRLGGKQPQREGFEACRLEGETTAARGFVSMATMTAWFQPPDLNNNKWKISFFEEELEFLFTLIMVRVPKYTNQITKSFQVNHLFKKTVYRQKTLVHRVSLVLKALAVNELR